jgi:hypothetical protein
MTIRVIHEIHFSHPLLSELHHLKDIIMTALEDLQAKAAESNAAIAALTAEVEVSNTKVDALIVTANMTKDALVALQGAGGATAEQLAAVIAQMQGGIDSANAAKTSLVAQEAETDAANAQVAP